MNPRFETFRKSELGQSIEKVARKPERLVEYALLSRLGIPAVVAISWDVKPVIASLSESDRREAKQYCGAIVGDVMRENGYEIANPRGSAQAGGLFTFGAVWALAESDDARTARIARDVMDQYSETFEALAKS